MDFKTALFYVFSAIMIIAATRVITARNPVHAALFLVLAFFNAAGIWMLLKAEFLAIVLVLVYVGAVMVLFLFVVMMLDINIDRMREGFWGYLPLASGIGARAVLTGLMPEWLILADASMLIAFSMFCFAAAIWRHFKPGPPPPLHDVKRIPNAVLVTINAFLALVSLAALGGIWTTR